MSDKCDVCGKKVDFNPPPQRYNNRVYHTLSCWKCDICKRQLTLGNVLMENGKLLCTIKCRRPQERKGVIAGTAIPPQHPKTPPTTAPAHVVRPVATTSSNSVAPPVPPVEEASEPLFVVSEAPKPDDAMVDVYWSHAFLRGSKCPSSVTSVCSHLKRHVVNEQCVHSAAVSGDVATLEKLLNVLAADNAMDQVNQIVPVIRMNRFADAQMDDSRAIEYLCPLWLALVASQEKTAAMLIQRGADIKLRNPRTGTTAIAYAVRGSSVANVRLVWNYEEAMLESAGIGFNAFHVLGHSGSPKVAEEIFTRLIKPGSPEAVRALRSTTKPFGRDSVRFFTQEGVERDVRFLSNNSGGATPAYFAMGHGRLEMLEIFHKAAPGNAFADGYLGMYLSQKCKNCSVGVANHGGEMIGKALGWNFEGSIKFLEKHEPKIRVSAAEVSLLKAAWAGDTGAVDGAIRAGASIHCRNTEYGNSPLHLAAYKGNVSMAHRLLLQHGANINQRNLHGSSPIILAANEGHYEMCKYLLTVPGVDVNLQNSAFSATALQLASMAGHANVVQLLLQAGANISAPNLFGNTPLHLAVWKRRQACVDVLVHQFGAPQNVLNMKGLTPAEMVNYVSPLGI